jgi:hypothetical protein
MHPLEQYLIDVRTVYSSGAGTPETSYYTALNNLLNEVGKPLKPRVHAIMQIQNRGAGMPDGGLFTADQIRQRDPDDDPLPGDANRGVIEVKGIADDAFVTAEGEQVSRYWDRYGQVLVTNLRDFVLIGRDDLGNPIKQEVFRLAESESEFREAFLHPRKAASEMGDRFLDFLKRVMLQSAPITSPEDLAWLLAAHAREALARTERAELAQMTIFREDLEESLGLTFEGERGDHFFRSTLVQTLFYGLFSAWVLWNREARTGPKDRFDWRVAHWHLRVPMVRAIYERLAIPTRLTQLDLAEVLEWTGIALNRVDRTAFFSRFEEEAAVQHFYEPFLAAFDPELRKQLGVWYTPKEVVTYMVERVDTVLREELDLPDGLADDRVVVLDPCTGTGSYLVEVLKKIYRTLTEKGGDALTAADVKQAALKRVYGFEIMPAPFVIAHMQVGLFLREIGAPLDESGQERAGIYLTNALTGWDEPDGPQYRMEFPELQLERDAADKVKRNTPILVVLGNPPYNGYAGIAIDEERDLVDAYRSVKHVRRPQGQGLNDLYVRFFRMAERRIIEMTGSGVVCYISNYSWLSGLSFTGMRERYLEAFSQVWIDNLHGDRIISEVAPDGRASETVFSVRGQSPGIKVGAGISLLVRNPDNEAGANKVYYRDLHHSRSDERRAALLSSLDEPEMANLYKSLNPPISLGLPFTPMRSDAEYDRWPTLPELFPVSYPGVKTSRDELLVDIDRDRLIERMKKYFDPNVSHEEMRRISPSAMNTTKRFDAPTVRTYLQQRGFLKQNVVRYCYRPFDVRWLYWEPETKLLDEKRTEYFPQVFDGNRFLEARQRQPRAAFDRGYVTSHIADNFANGLSAFFPLLLVGKSQDLFSATNAGADYNQSHGTHMYLDSMTLAVDMPLGTELFLHAVATIRAAQYRSENAESLRQDWPRIPLPDSKELLERSAELGRQVADLLDPEQPVTGVTTGVIRPEMRVVANVQTIENHTLDPATDLELTAGWGYRGQRGVVMPGGGTTVQRPYTSDEREAIITGAEALRIDPEEAFIRLGEENVDVFLNDRAYWGNIPINVWSYTIGGYQVIKKWLSYRESKVLGRHLRREEAREVQNIARRITALLLLEPALDANYQAVKANVYPWPEEDTAARTTW